MGGFEGQRGWAGLMGGFEGQRGWAELRGWLGRSVRVGREVF